MEFSHSLTVCKYTSLRPQRRMGPVSAPKGSGGDHRLQTARGPGVAYANTRA
jgi:hypothetical protein